MAIAYGSGSNDLKKKTGTGVLAGSVGGAVVGVKPQTKPKTKPSVGTGSVAGIAVQPKPQTQPKTQTQNQTTQYNQNNQRPIVETEEKGNQMTPDENIITQTDNADKIAGTPMVLGETTLVTADPDIQGMMRDLEEEKRQQIYAQFDAAYNKAVRDLDDREAGLGQQYYDKRNQVGAQSDVSALNFAQYMAGRGIKGNAGAMPEIYRNAALQSNLGSLYTQEQAARDTLARDRTNLKSALEADKASALAGLSAESLQQYINQMNADRASRQWQQSFDLNKQQQEIDNAYRQKSFDENVRQFNLKYGLDLRQMSFNEAQAKIENAYKQGQLSLAQARQALDEAQFAYAQKQNNQEQTSPKAVFDSYYKIGSDLKKTGGTNKQLLNWLMSLPVSDDIRAQLGLALGISAPEMPNYQSGKSYAY